MKQKLPLLFLAKIARFALVLVIAVTANQCSVNPVTGKKELSFMSESQEKQMGASYHPQVMSEFGEYNDPKLQTYINEIGQKMAKISHRPTLPFQFKVVDSEVVNAFAVPGGYVYFTRGILAHFNNEAQLAGVLGHEIGHVTARHGAQQQTQQMLGQIALVGAMIASPKLAQFGNELSQGMQLLFLKFGRDDESQSDMLGVNYSSKIGFDAREMAGFFNTLARMGGGERVPTFLSTHPDPGDRNVNVKSMANEYQQKNPSNYNVNRDGYFRLIDGIIYGKDPKQGYVENNMFYHPELKFQFSVPTGWQHQNSPSQFSMASPDQKAMMILATGQGKSLEEAANTFLQQHKLMRIYGRATTINGMQAIEQACEQDTREQPQGGTPQQQPVMVKNIMIMYNNLIYSFVGVSETATFRNYEALFDNTMRSFNVLNDPSKINVVPERVRVKQVSREMTFADAMRSFGMPEAKLKELSILNGMEATERVPSGTLLKTVSK